MKKIPVGATIAHAYRFAFGQAPAMLRAIWLPLLVQLVATYFLFRRTVLFLAAMQAQDPSATTLFGPVLLLFLLVVILFFVQLTAAMETALGQPPRSWFYFPIGGKMWRLLAGFVAVLASLVALMVLYILALYLLGFVAQAVLRFPVSAGTARATTLLIASIVVLVAYAGAIFLAVRFLFLLAPSNMTGPDLGVARAWHLSAGNFWRALLIIIVILAPVALMHYGYIFSVAGVPPTASNASKEAVRAAEMAWRIQELNALASRWYLTFPLTGLLLLFQFGAACAAQVYAMNALTEGEASAPVASSAQPD